MRTSVAPAKTEKKTLTIIRKISQRTLNKKNQLNDVPSFPFPAGHRKRTIALDNFSAKKPSKQPKPRVNVKMSAYHPEECSEEDASLQQTKSSKTAMKSSGMTGQLANEM